MQLIDSKELMIQGDRFEINHNDWYRLLMSPIQDILPRTSKKVECEVLRVYARSSYELRYLCKRTGELHGAERNEFVLAQFLEQPYQVSAIASDSELLVSALVITEAAARCGARPISEFLPSCYLKKDADRVASEIQKMQLKENYGYLIPAKGWR